MLSLARRRVCVQSPWCLTAATRGLATIDEKDAAPASPPKELAGVGLAKRLGWDPQSITVDDTEGFNRYKLLVPAFMNHLCLGSVFAWSIFNNDLTKLGGVVAQAPTDWSLGDVSLTFSLVMAGFGWGALLGKHLDAWGPRASCALGAACVGSGFGLAAFATHIGSLPLLYAGGLVWGFANGVCYVPPVAALLKWFPDRKGFGGGATLIGFGGGAMVATPVFGKLIDHFRVVPEYVGPSLAHDLINEDGHMYLADTMQEVVVASAAQASSYGLEEGIYLLGTGSTGIAQTLLTMGAGYACIMGLCSTMFKLPPAGYQPAGVEAPAAGPGDKPVMKAFDVDVATASSTKQFWLMWTGFGLSICGAYGILSTGKTMLQEGFQVAAPELVTAGFAASFVAMISLANLGGRVFWSNVSDVLCKKVGGDPFTGRKMTYTLMWGMTPPLYAAVVWSVHNFATSPGVFPLAVFTGSVCLIVSSFGGSAATRPAIVSDLFGTNNVGVLTARQLSVVLPSAWAGPKIATSLREHSIMKAIDSLSEKVEDEAFLVAFGTDKAHLPELIDQKSISIARLMEVVPPGTVDPTPFVYDDVMYAMVGLNVVAVLCNLATFPVAEKYHTKPDTRSP